VVFPATAEKAYAKRAAVEVLGEQRAIVNGAWKVEFQPPLNNTFYRTFTALTDFSLNADTAVKYFAGTAVYQTRISVSAGDLGANRRVILDLGALNDIAELEINGQAAGVLWNPPYRADVTKFLRAGENRVNIAVSVNWANRLIGDEQYPADFEWGADHGVAGHAMKAFPDWFVNNQPRPSKGRKCFTVWYYYRKDSPLKPAGLTGPVQVITQEIKSL
jgi:hypothetical protein